MSETQNMDAVPFAERVINETATLIHEVTTRADGTPRDLPSDVLVGVLNAQSNLAIAAALMVVAQGVARGRG